MLILMCLKQGKGKFGLVLVFPFLGKEGEVVFFSGVEKLARNNLYPTTYILLFLCSSEMEEPSHYFPTACSEMRSLSARSEFYNYFLCSNEWPQPLLRWSPDQLLKWQDGRYFQISAGSGVMIFLYI